MADEYVMRWSLHDSWDVFPDRSGSLELKSRTEAQQMKLLLDYLQGQDSCAVWEILYKYSVQE
jgi:hypothetical protein